MFKTLKHFVF